MKVLDVFQHNTDHHFLHWKDTSDPSLRSWKLAPKKLFNGLASGDLLLQPFFQPLCLPSPAPDNGRVDSAIDFTPLATSLTFPTGTHIFSAIPTKTFRQACATALVPSHLRAINGHAWKSFWSLALTMVQRNVLYRFISNSIPHKSLLHRVFTDLHPSPLCTICSISTETSVHFLFHCPPKATVWRAIIFEFLWPTVSIQDIITAITSLDFHNIKYCQRSEVSAPIIVILTLANIWRAHFRTVFDATPFEAQTIIANIRADVIRRINEDQVHSTI
ncbi:hypothetical protein [Parasitella parasitica]|nr:hypothetical protein [Parasitella parasitica]